jgi:hypothetical protein
MSDIYELHQRIDALEVQLRAQNVGGSGPGFADFAKLSDELRAEVAAIKSNFASLNKDLRAAIADIRKTAKPIDVFKLLETIADPIAEQMNAAKDRTERQIEAVRADTGAAALAAKNAARANAEVRASNLLGFARLLSH